MKKILFILSYNNFAKYYIPFICFALLLGAGFLLVAGCRKSGLDGLYPVKGKITSNGEPLEGVSISLSPISNTPDRRPASALSDKNGNFSLTTLKPNDGAFPGEYKVSLSKVISSMTYEQIKEIEMSGKNAFYKAQDAMPEKYRLADTSNITLTVKAGHNPLWLIDIPESLEKVTFLERYTYEAQKPKKK
ncbi:MAG: carboxypeptidase-like regulatory domain-containing protein [Planctomycetaceae bacterium]|jgi:hypothetical protein|nr:carboxypeptidase-like regulatory domain-containing protein [Planctomycetaceae bacterium]